MFGKSMIPNVRMGQGNFNVGNPDMTTENRQMHPGMQ